MKKIQKLLRNSRICSQYDVTVEAELGRIAGQEDEIIIDEKDTMLTNPEIALDFVSKTKVDSLAIAIGTAHGVYKFDPELDYSRLQEIRNKVDIPLVLHWSFRCFT